MATFVSFLLSSIISSHSGQRSVSPLNLCDNCPPPNNPCDHCPLLKPSRLALSWGLMLSPKEALSPHLLAPFRRFFFSPSSASLNHSNFCSRLSPKKENNLSLKAWTTTGTSTSLHIAIPIGLTLSESHWPNFNATHSTALITLPRISIILPSDSS